MRHKVAPLFENYFSEFIQRVGQRGMLGRSNAPAVVSPFSRSAGAAANSKLATAGEATFRALLIGWSQRSVSRSLMKAGVYAGSAGTLIAAILLFKSWWAVLICQALLGLVYAHGLELTHEALHHNMFERNRYNRILGFITAAPMLVSYSHYRFQHLHHHRFVGTAQDKELFDYDARSLRNPIAFIARAFNLMRIPAFFRTLLRMWRGQFPDVFATPAQQNDALVEYIIIASVFTLALTLTLLGVTNFFLMVWLIPWLGFGEFFHFLIELPEHIGCDKTSRDVRVNTRTYLTNPVWFYIANGNNYHIEHHLYPHVAVHKLRYLCAYLANEGVTPVPSTFRAFRALFAGRQK